MFRPQIIGLVASVFLVQSCTHNAEQAKRTALGRGQQYYRAGSYSDAEIQFRKSLQEDQRFGEAELWLGRAEARQNKYVPAAETLKRAGALLPGSDEPKIELGNIYLLTYLSDPNHSAQMYRQVAAIADDLLARHPDSFDGWRFRAYLATTDADPARALDFLEKANQLKPDQPDIVTTLCQSLIRADRAAEAEKTALAFLQKTPNYGPLYTMLSEYYMQANRPADAESILLRKVAANPKESLYRIELARHYLRAGKPADVSKVLDQMISDPKTFPQANLVVGAFFSDARDWAQARRYFTDGAMRDPARKLTYLRHLAQAELAAGDRNAATQALDQIIKEDPKDLGSQSSRAALRMATKDPGQIKLATAEFKAIVDKAPDNAEYRFQYASALRENGDVDAARAEYQNVLRKNPNHVPALGILADLSIRNLQVDEALSYANRVLAIEQGNVAARLVRSGALAAKGLYAEARGELNGLVRDHPDLREAQLQLAMVDVAQKHYSEAETRFRRNFQPGSGDVRVLEGLVEVYRARNQLDQAIALLQQDLKTEPQAVAVRLLLAQTAAQAGQKQLAIGELKQVAAAQPASVSTALQLGLAYQAIGDFAQAVNEFERARQLAPQNAQTHAFLARALDLAGRKTDALASYRQSLLLDGRNPEVLNNLAYLIAESGGDLNEALRLSKTALTESPDNPSFNDTAGWIYMKKNDFPNAILAFQKAKERQPGDVNSRLHLGEALLRSGARSQSRAEFEAALKIASDPEQKRTIAHWIETTR